MMTRSSANRSSQGQPIRHSREKASITTSKSSGLGIDEWTVRLVKVMDDGRWCKLKSMGKKTAVSVRGLK